MMPKIPKEWRKPLSNAAKAEMLASTFHLFTDHMPELFSKLPGWLQKQINQTMYDCSVDHRDLTKADIKRCIEYGQWLNAKYPQKKPRKPRYLHFGIKSRYSTGLQGCCRGTSLKDAQNNVFEDERDLLVRMPEKDCPICREMSGTAVAGEILNNDPDDL